VQQEGHAGVLKVLNVAIVRLALTNEPELCSLK
jgi:hypothetical protein